MQLATFKNSSSLQFAKIKLAIFQPKVSEAVKNRRKNDGICFANEPPSADDNKESVKMKGFLLFPARFKTYEPATNQKRLGKISGTQRFDPRCHKDSRSVCH